MTEHAGRAHAWLSASGSSIWLNCPRSAVLSRDLERRSSTYADEGTKAHELAEAMILGRVHPMEDIPDDMTMWVAPYVRHVLRLANIGPEYFAVEKRITLAPLWAPGEAPTDMFGTADAVAVVDDWLYVSDLKYGKYHLVEARGSTQLRYYALGVYLALPDKLRDAVQMVRMTIVQPRGDHPEGPERYWDQPVVDLLHWGYEVLKPMVDRITSSVDGEDLDLRDGDHCRWCPAQMRNCPVKLQGKLDNARQMFDEV